jgi:hypothetical protein
MRRFHWGLAAVALPVFALGLFVAGCGKDDKKDNPSGGGTGGQQTQENKTKLTVLEPKDGILKGKITLKGTPSDSYETELKAEMAKKKEDVCMKGSESETTQQVYRVGPDKALGNVFVWVKPAPGTFFKIDESKFPDLKKPVEIHQPHCAFIPHSLFLVPGYPNNPEKKRDMKKTGQYLVIHNDASIQHNTNWKGEHTQGNELIPPNGKKEVKDFRPETAPVHIKCDIHTWMDAYVRVVDTPYHAISKSDTFPDKDPNKAAKDSPEFGTYEIKDLPEGKVRVFVWHEKSDWLNQGKADGEEVVIKAGEATTKNFEAEAK